MSQPTAITHGHRPPRPFTRAAALFVLLLGGCATAPPPGLLNDAQVRAAQFRVSDKPSKAALANAAALAAFEGPADDVYRLGSGDRVRVDVWGRPELSGPRIVGPDGRVTVPVIGAVEVADLSSDEAGERLTRAVRRVYVDTVATLSIEEYTANRVLVLGRVSKPGVLQFENRPTLLDALTRAGSLPIGGIGADKAALTRCAVFRGRDQVVWIDLKSLLTGRNLEGNIRLKRDDLVYVPDAGDQLVYVLGYVDKPGAYVITPDMSLLDALAQAGGPNPDAAASRMKLVRPAKGLEADIDLDSFLAASDRQNFALEEGDILYVPPNWLAQVGYVLQKVSPATNMAVFAAAL